MANWSYEYDFFVLDILPLILSFSELNSSDLIRCCFFPMEV